MLRCDAGVSWLEGFAYHGGSGVVHSKTGVDRGNWGGVVPSKASTFPSVPLFLLFSVEIIQLWSASQEWHHHWAHDMNHQQT